MNAKQTLYDYFLDGTLAGKNLTEISKFLKISVKEKKTLANLLDSLQDEGKIFQNEVGRYGITVKKGVFGADMQISQHNDGPVTILLEA